MPLRPCGRSPSTNQSSAQLQLLSCWDPSFRHPLPGIFALRLGGLFLSRHPWGGLPFGIVARACALPGPRPRLFGSGSVSPCGWAGPRVRLSRCLRVAPALRGLLCSVLCLPSTARLAACCRLPRRAPLGRGPRRLAFGVSRQHGQYSTGHTESQALFAKKFRGVPLLPVGE